MAAYGPYDRAWQLGVLVSFDAGIVQIFAGGPVNRRDHIAPARLATG